MDLYHIWCDLKAGVRDVEFCEHVERYLGHLQSTGRAGGHRITRRKLGLGPKDLAEFHIQVEFEDLAQLDRAFHAAAERSEPVEGLHAAVNQLACNLTFALYRDFPDSDRRRGAERF